MKVRTSLKGSEKRAQALHKALKPCEVGLARTNLVLQQGDAIRRKLIRGLWRRHGPAPQAGLHRALGAASAS